jgi:hypothetical protein
MQIHNSLPAGLEDLKDANILAAKISRPFRPHF